MKKRKNRWSKKTRKLVFTGLFLVVVLTIVIMKQRPDEYLHIVFCDVGQGDSILLVKGNLQMIVDGGPDDKILSCLGKYLPFWDRQIELIVSTHPEADHITGLLVVMDRYKVERIIKTTATNDTDQYRESLELLDRKQIPISLVMSGSKVRLGQVGFKVLWPEKETVERVDNLNDTSVVLLGNFGNFDFLLTGDLGEDQEKELIREGKLKSIELLKVGHHGSKFSSGSEWLEKLSPKISVISVGKKNRFGHPTDEVLERLRLIGSRVFRTDKDGSVEVVSDGKGYWVKK